MHYKTIVLSGCICKFLGPEICQQQHTSQAVSKYSAYLRKVYLRSKLPVKGKWPPSPCKKIIKLAIVKGGEQLKSEPHRTLEAIDEYMLKNSRKEISIDNLLHQEDGSPSKTVVVQGVPGIGKSTFAWKFCRKWAKGKIYKKYNLIVLLRMRDTIVREATKLSDLFFSEDEESSKQVAKEVIAEDGKNTLILLEGMDELPASCVTDGTLISNLLQGLSLPEVTILVTTRPWALQMLKEICGDQISLEAEILGFTKKDIQRYVFDVFPEVENAEFLEYIHLQPQLESIMHVPLNAAFVVQIYKEFKCSQQAIPQTLTQLYTALVNGLLLRYTKSLLEFCDLRFTTLEDLPEPIKSSFEQLCVLAFMSFTKLNVQVTFTDSEAALYGCLDSLGLMQSCTNLSIHSGTTVTHSFLHFTIQEFLAAYHLSKLPNESQEIFFQIHCKDPRFMMIIRFLIGLNSQVPKHMNILGNSIYSKHLLWLFESQSPFAVRDCLGTGELFFAYPEQLLFDIYALIYCLCHSDCQWKIWVDLTKLQSVFQSDDMVNSGFKGYIARLSITDCTDVGIRAFFSLPRRIFSRLSTLQMHIRVNEKSTGLALAEALKSQLFPALVDFTLTFEANIENTNIGAMIEDLDLRTPELKLISVSNGILTPSDMLPLCSHISSPTRLSTLTFKNSRFIDESLQLLFSAVACSRCLVTLNLPLVKMSLADIEVFSLAISTNSSMRTLRLYNCSLGREGVMLLATGLEENQTLTKLDLSCNDIDTAGAAALARMLTVNTSIKYLFLTDNKMMGTEGVIKLLISLEQNCSIEKLVLSRRCQPVEFGTLLMEDIRASKRVTFCSDEMV